MKKFLIIALLPLGIGAVHPKPLFQYSYVEFEFVNRAKSYIIEVSSDESFRPVTERLFPRQRGTLDITPSTNNGRSSIKVNIKVFDKSNNELENKMFLMSYDEPLATSTTGQVPTIFIDYSKGWFGKEGFTFKTNALINGFEAKDITAKEKEPIDVSKISML